MVVDALTHNRKLVRVAVKKKLGHIQIRVKSIGSPTTCTECDGLVLELAY